MPSLTTHLLQLDPTALHSATAHPFLTVAATSGLNPIALKAWLSQDRLYALSYVSFIGTLLSRTPISTSSSRESSQEWACADRLIDCLTNIRREIRLFEDTAAAEGWLVEISDEVKPSVQTRAYQDLFAGATAQGRPLVVGLTVLWATEECYLRAWKFAKEKMVTTRGKARDGGEEDVMQRVFIPNWSSPEFEVFVQRIRELVDGYGAAMKVGEWEWMECEAAYRQVLWAEREFWPEVDEKET